jgi:hypothetical protein
MSRFALREFTIPSYANSIPPEDKEERPVQKIEKFATFLNEIPWFSKGEDDGEDGTPSSDDTTQSDISETLVEGKDPTEVAKYRANPAPLDQSVELQAMKNAGDDTDEFGRALEAAELKRNPLKAPVTDLFGKAELGKQLTDAPDQNDKDAVMAWQTKLNELGYNLDVDGIWGNKSKAAYKDWYSKKWGK